jgi:triosephosphate isomerase
MKKIIVANWKMNPQTPREAKALALKTKALTTKLEQVSVIICPPALYLPLFTTARASRQLWWGSQDVSLEAGEGAFTGEISAAMLAYSGAQFTIIGHSERRARGETDEVVNKKVKLALSARLKPIICVGESKRDEQGHYLEPLREQIKKALTGLDKLSLKKIIFAYEPVWAVGKKAMNADTPAEFQHHAIFIRKTLSDLFDKKLAMQVPVLYGGSVNSDNAEGFLKEGGADGLLVGRASLKPEEFKKILYVADH